jgi:protein disulfide-isomerase-like protein
MRAPRALVCGVLAALLACSLARAEDFYPKSTGVINLNAKNFDKVVGASHTVTIVEFYAPWCGHCKALKPEYIKLAKELKGLVQVAALDCDDAANRPLAGKYGIQGFPTIKIFTGAKQPVDYQVGWRAKALHAHPGALAIPARLDAATDRARRASGRRARLATLPRRRCPPRCAS